MCLFLNFTYNLSIKFISILKVLQIAIDKGHIKNIEFVNFFLLLHHD